jgi:outer membrane protein OmpA-like peptidoglycan-associated protein
MRAGLMIEARMRPRIAAILLTTLLSACSGPLGAKYPVRFPPFDAGLDPQAQAAVRAAATFAAAHPLMPVTISGYRQPLDPSDIETLRQERVQTVQRALLQEGVGSERIEILGNGLLYPDGVPDSPKGRVDINIGL